MSSQRLLWTICVEYQNNFTPPDLQAVRRGQEHCIIRSYKMYISCAFPLVPRILWTTAFCPTEKVVFTWVYSFVLQYTVR